MHHLTISILLITIVAAVQALPTDHETHAERFVDMATRDNGTEALDRDTGMSTTNLSVQAPGSVVKTLMVEDVPIVQKASAEVTRTVGSSNFRREETVQERVLRRRAMFLKHLAVASFVWAILSQIPFMWICCFFFILGFSFFAFWVFIAVFGLTVEL